jgi:hypothetical protein
MSLDSYKNMIVGQLIYERGQRLGFEVQAEYPAASGNLFSCSDSSQSDWSKLVAMESLGLVVYPFAVYTFDERVAYGITDSADLTAIVTAVSVAVLAERALAQGHIDAVLAAADEAAVDAAAAPYLA